MTLEQLRDEYTKLTVFPQTACGTHKSLADSVSHFWAADDRHLWAAAAKAEAFRGWRKHELVDRTALITPWGPGAAGRAATWRPAAPGFVPVGDGGGRLVQTSLPPLVLSTTTVAAGLHYFGYLDRVYRALGAREKKAFLARLFSNTNLGTRLNFFSNLGTNFSPYQKIALLRAWAKKTVGMQVGARTVGIFQKKGRVHTHNSSALTDCLS